MSRKLILFHAPGTIRWLLNSASTDDVRLDGFPGWHLVSPLKCVDYASFSPYIVSLIEHNGLHFLETRAVIFEHSTITSFGEERTPAAIDVGMWCLRSLRYISKQATISNSWIEAKIVDDTAESNKRKVSEGKAHRYRTWVVETAVTDDHLQRLSSLPEDYQPPVYAEVLLDAIEANVIGHHRTAVLYAAIAIESLAQHVLADRYLAILTEEPPSGEYRVVELPEHGGKTVRKDPVYVSLSASTRFPYLLHERPLYLLKRSLLKDDERLYRQAVELYQARNDLAHHGVIKSKVIQGQVVKPKRNPFPISIEGAEAALAVAIKIFCWFGAEPGYNINKDWTAYQS